MIASLRPMCWSCVPLGPSSTIRSCMENSMDHPLLLCQNGPGFVLMGCSTGLDRLRRLRRVDLSGKEKGKGDVQLENSTHTRIQLTHVSKSSGSRCEVDGGVSRHLIVHLSSWSTQFCVAPPLYTIEVPHVHPMDNVCACLWGFSVAYDCVRADHFGSRTDRLLDEYILFRVQVSRQTREYCRDYHPCREATTSCAVQVSAC